MTDTTRLPDASEDRVIECPVCSRTMTTMESGGVTVDVCAGGCGGIWFDWFELARVDEANESAGEKFLEVERDPTLHPELSKRIRCPRDGEIMMRHFHSVKRGVLVDECPRCAGFWLDAGKLAGIRSEFATEEERKKAAEEYFSELFDPNLAVPVRFGGEEHSGWLPANAASPPPTPVEDALVDFEIHEVAGGYILEWSSRDTSHHGDSWHETLEGALEQASTEFGVRPEEFCSA